MSDSVLAGKLTYFMLLDTIPVKIRGFIGPVPILSDLSESLALVAQYALYIYICGNQILYLSENRLYLIDHRLHFPIIFLAIFNYFNKDMFVV